MAALSRQFVISLAAESFEEYGRDRKRALYARDDQYALGCLLAATALARGARMTNHDFELAQGIFSAIGIVLKLTKNRLTR
jgi:hypothetical protein